MSSNSFLFLGLFLAFWLTGCKDKPKQVALTNTLSPAQLLALPTAPFPSQTEPIATAEKENQPAVSQTFIHLETRFIGLNEATVERLDLIRRVSLCQNQLEPEKNPGHIGKRVSGVLSKEELNSLFQILETAPGVDIVKSPQLVTVSGRQAQIQATEKKEIKDAGTVSIGTTIDILAMAQQPTNVIHLQAISVYTTFLGYDSKDQLPQFRVQSSRAKAQVKPGETLVFGGFTSIGPDPEKGRDYEWLIYFITPTRVDAAGNPIL